MAATLNCTTLGLGLRRLLLFWALGSATFVFGSKHQFIDCHITRWEPQVARSLAPPHPLPGKQTASPLDRSLARSLAPSPPPPSHASERTVRSLAPALARSPSQKKEKKNKPRKIEKKKKKGPGGSGPGGGGPVEAVQEKVGVVGWRVVPVEGGLGGDRSSWEWDGPGGSQHFAFFFLSRPSFCFFFFQFPRSFVELRLSLHDFIM